MLLRKSLTPTALEVDNLHSRSQHLGKNGTSEKRVTDWNTVTRNENILNQHNSSNTFAYLAAHYTLNILHKPSKLNERSDR